VTLLRDFLCPVEIEICNDKRRKLPIRHRLPIQAYAVDKPCGEENLSLQSQFKMDSFHCCDYIYPTSDSILFIEDTNLMAKKNEYKKQETPESAISKLIRYELLLKAYGSLLIFHHLLIQFEDAEHLRDDKKLSFWVIATDADISEARTFDSIRDQMKSTLNPLVSEVCIYPLKEAQERLSPHAQPHP